jgi:HEAT repeat protein
VNLNGTERLFLLLVLVVVGGGGLLALNAAGVPVPFLTTPSPSVDRDPRDGLPPPTPDLAEEERLAELDAAGPAWDAELLPEADWLADRAEEDGHLEGDDVARGDGANDADSKKVRDPLVDQMKAGLDPEDPGQIMAFLIGTFTPNGTKLGEEDLDLLLKALTEQKDFGLRNLVMAHLERIGGETVTQGLLAFLQNDKDPASLTRAMNALKRQNDEAAVVGLVEFMADTKNGRLRDAAYRNILGTKNAAATEPLIDALGAMGADDTHFVRYAVSALSQIGGARGAEVVVSYAFSSDPTERGVGVRLLTNLRSPEAVPALSEALGTSRDAHLSVQVMRSLGQIGHESAIPSVSRVALYEESPGLRHVAMRSLAQIGSASAIPTLQQIVQTEENKGIQRAAERTITSIEKTEAKRAARAAQKAAR